MASCSAGRLTLPDQSEEALARYEAAPKARGTNVQLWSREQGRNLQASRKGQTAVERGLLDYDPVTVPV
jgi:salicylate hydroxylase